jgi:hypothetical protein
MTMTEVVEREEQAPGPVVTSTKWELKKLTTRHRRIVQLKAAGLDRVSIASMCKCTPEYISMLLAQPLVKEYLNEQHIAIDEDLRDLYAPAVNTIRTMMTSSNDKVALGAATVILKANGKLSTTNDDDSRVTAEDIITKIFSIANSNVQININERTDDAS